MKEGECQKLTATITPENVTDKNITWKSSDESIAIISSSGEIIAKKAGTVEITAITSNEKTNMIKINIKEDSNPLAGVITLGVLGGGSYWGYKKYKEKRK